MLRNLFAVACFVLTAAAQNVPPAHAAVSDPLAAGFRTPPDSAKPLTFWQWMNGCVTKEGITSDLEAFKRAGLGGTQQFLVGGSEAVLDDPDVEILNPHWRDLMKFAMSESARLGLTFGTHNCPGWSSSGGPWVKVEDSMQKLVWSTQSVAVGATFAGTLPRPTADPKWDYYKDIAILAVPAVTENEPIPQDKIVDVTERMRADGWIEWSPPAGAWTILRFGHTTVGKINGTAPVSGQGLETDKFSRAALDAFWAGFPEQIIAEAGSNAGTTLKRFEIDSYEAGPQDWTPDMAGEFQRRRGYDLRPWLPALAQRTVGSRELTERFMYDWRRTINELFAENYIGHMAELIHRVPGMEFLLEPYATGHGEIFDTTVVSGYGDLLMCEFWQKPATWGWDSVKPVASAAHTWGKRIVAAEAFTGQPQYAWQTDPYALKATGDRAFCMGVNQFILHASAHQPWPQLKPGMTMGWWGTQFGPGQTWWEHGGPEWLAYVTRCQYMLQQGVFVADICYLVRGRVTPRLPAGYDGDTLGEGELLTRLNVRDGLLVLPDGQSYRLLVLPNSTTMTPAIARKLRQLVSDGATIIGPKPTTAPGLEGYPENVQEVVRIGDELWGATGGQPAGEHAYGKGRVVWGQTPAEVLAVSGVVPDVQFESEGNLLWIHRRVGEAEIYFLSNQRDEPVSARASFRVRGLAPELWHADTGEINSAQDWSTDGNRTTVALDFDPSGSVFVVFRKPTTNTGGSDITKSTAPPAIVTVDGGWELLFPPNWGAPEKVTLDELISWPNHANPGVKYFSGTATYVKEIEVPAALLSASWRATLDLGKVKNIASVRLNGRDFAALWKPPFRVNVTGALQPGKNVLEIRVTNLWPNRLIGDEQEPDDGEWGPVRTFTYVRPAVTIGRPLLTVPTWINNPTARPSAGRRTFSTFDFFNLDSPLLESGLIGPVRLEIVEQASVNN